MTVINLPRRDPPSEPPAPSDHAAEIAAKLRELADEVESGGAVRGAIVIMDTSRPEKDRFRAVPSGNMRQSRELTNWALSWVQFRLVTQQG